MSKISKEARAAANAYIREWRAANPDKVKEYARRYWQRRAEKQAQGQPAGQGDAKGGASND